MSSQIQGTTLQLEADVLVIGGGPAGAWAALTAAAKGSKVVLADKGFCGSSGATAPSGTGVWYVEPEARQRQEAKMSRYFMGGRLAENEWMDRVLDQTYENMNRLGGWGIRSRSIRMAAYSGAACRDRSICVSCASW